MDRLNKAVFWGVILSLIWTGAALSASPPKVLGVREKLPNGLVWLFSEQSGLPLVTFNLLVKAGTLQDPRGKEGLANLTAILLRSGTKKRNAAKIAAELDFLGARLGAGGDDDYAQLSLTVLKKDLAAGLDIFQDVLLNPVFAPPEVARKVAQIQASLKSDEDEPGVVAARTFNKDLFGAFPYGHPIRGTPEGLAAITPKDLVEFHRRYWRPNNAILCVAGDLTLEEARKWVTQTLGSWPAGEIPAPKWPDVPSLKERRVVMINKDISQANIILGNLGISRANPDFYALQVMNYILGGGGFASRLMENIRVKRGLAYSVSSQFDPGLEPGYFAVTLETKNASAGEAVEQVLAELKRIREKPVTPEELQDAKSYLIGSFPRKMDSLAKRAWLMGYAELYGLGLDYPWRYPQLIRDLTPTDIQKAAWKYVHPEKFLLIVVGKKSEIPSLFGSKPPAGKEEKKDAPKKPHH
ncbi:MAG: M16 family metallopeptidase [Thermodesulfobacteriota bacterium]